MNPRTAAIRAALGWGLAVAVIAVLALVAVAPTTAEPRTVPEASPLPRSRVPRPKARLLTGRIRRDRVTLESIRQTAAVRLPRNAGDNLRLLLTKARYRLDIYAGDRLLKVYPVALGAEPRGAKRWQGDQRTPEGDYLLIPHHPSPRFGSCFYVCYPGGVDARRGVDAGWLDGGHWLHILVSQRWGLQPPHYTPLGGLILIHGTRDRRQTGLTVSNWTEGCIAMENSDLLELLDAFSPDDRPVITIRR